MRTTLSVVPALTEGAESSEVAALVREGLAAFNEPKVGPRNTLPLVLAVHDERGDTVGGLTGKTYWNALHIEMLWVSDAVRSRGYGRQLVEAAEGEALSRGAELAYVTTLSFQAPGFYERLGYRRFANLEGVPKGASRLWYSKELTLPIDTLSAIPRFIELSDALASAGQPSQQQLADIAAAGFAVVINLGLLDPGYALEDEAGAVRALGMEYVHIPVEFSSPGLDDLARFTAAMAAADGKRVFVHCRHNKRVPVFIALDRILRQGWAHEAAFADMRRAWSPDEAWEDFIFRALGAS